MEQISFLNWNDLQSNCVKENQAEYSAEKTFLKDDHDCVSFDEEGFKNYMQHCKENDEWREIPINSFSVQKSLNSDTGFEIVFAESDEPIPVRYTAIPTLLERAGLSCPTLLRESSGSKSRVLSKEIKASWISQSLGLYEGNCKMLIRDGKASSVMSGGYKILPVYDLVDVLENAVKIENPNLTLQNASVNYEYIVSDYNLNNELMEESFELMLKEHGRDIGDSKIKACLRFSTSDIGNAKASIRALVQIDKKIIPVGKPMGVKHDGENTVETFNENALKVGAIFKEAEEAVEKAGNIDVKDVAGCIQHIMEEHKFISKKCSEKKLPEFKAIYNSGGTGIDVYLCLQEIFELQASDKSLAQFIDLSEEFAKLLYLDFSKYDRPYMEKN